MTTTEAGAARRYVPAAGRVAFTGLYDGAVALTMREDCWRPVLRAQVLGDVPAGGCVADVGAGTGTLAVELARTRRDVEVVAVDGDDRALRRARRKPGAEWVRWRRGLASELPLDDQSVDAVVMSLLLHHLDAAGKDAALREAVRVLRPNGVLHVADWGRPRGLALHAGFFALRVLDGFDGTRDHREGRLPGRLASVGFEAVNRYAAVRTMWGRLELLRTAAPAPTGASRVGGRRSTRATSMTAAPISS